MENKKEKVPNQVKRDANKTETLCHCLVFAYHLYLVQHYKEGNHNKHSSKECIVGNIFHISV